MTVKIYIEGGGEGDRLSSVFREAWKAFFEKAGLAGKSPQVIRGGGRDQTWDKFRIAVATRHSDELPLLLVDSEEHPKPGMLERLRAV